jgi:hypothetical protein
MKQLFLLGIIVITTPLFGQIYMRTKKNIGFYGNYNYSEKNKSLNSFGFGFTKQLGHYILPEIGYRQQTNDVFRSNISPLNDRSHFIQTGMTFRKKILKINERKAGRSCQAELIELFVTPEFFGRIPKESENLKFNSAIRAGLGIYHFQTGFSRFSKMFQIKLEGYYRHNLSKDPIIPNEFGLQLRLQKFKVYDFTK